MEYIENLEWKKLYKEKKYKEAVEALNYEMDCYPLITTMKTQKTNTHIHLKDTSLLIHIQQYLNFLHVIISLWSVPHSKRSFR